MVGSGTEPSQNPHASGPVGAAPTHSPDDREKEEEEEGFDVVDPKPELGTDDEKAEEGVEVGPPPVISAVERIRAHERLRQGRSIAQSLEEALAVTQLQHLDETELKEFFVLILHNNFQSMPENLDILEFGNLGPKK